MRLTSFAMLNTCLSSRPTESICKKKKKKRSNISKLHPKVGGRAGIIGGKAGIKDLAPK